MAGATVDRRVCAAPGPEIEFMDLDELGNVGSKILHEILGYLNLSSGAPDPRFLGNLNELFGWIEGPSKRRARAAPLLPSPPGRPCKPCSRLLRNCRGPPRPSAGWIRRRPYCGLVFQQALPAYRQYHRDLLFHQTDERLFQPVFHRPDVRGRAPPGAALGPDRAHRGRALRQLNDFIGHRPVAVLQNEQKLQPYAHEWVRPDPAVRFAGPGRGAGRYHDLVEKALEILQSTDPAAPGPGLVQSRSGSTSWPSIPGPTTSTTRPTSVRITISASGTRTTSTTPGATAASWSSR